jgi:aromatic-amino-acid transaminase
MNASPFAQVELAPRDPILGLTEAFVADTNPNKVNLGVGVYNDDTGKLPLLRCVQAAERQVMEKSQSKGYLPIDGLSAYDRAVQGLVFGAESQAAKAGRIATIQALGGTGGLKVGADFLKRLYPESQIYISDPSWENHRALFEGAGFKVNTYPYYDAKTHGVRFEAMVQALQGLPRGAIVVLHACCHNPTGVDLSTDQWLKVVDVVKSAGLVAFLDMAYQGFGDGLEADKVAVQKFLDSGLSFTVSTSFSKSFSLYGERVGGLSVVTASKDEADRVLSQLKRLIRTNYSSPPTHGAQIVSTVLASPDLRVMWEQELGEMRDRIKRMRALFVEQLKANGVKRDFSFVMQQRGMFSYSGLDAPTVERLRKEYAIYAITTGRICVAALNTKNIGYVTKAIAKVLEG